MENVQAIVEGGAIGVAVLAILLVGYLIKLMMKFFGNHIKHSIESTQHNTDMMVEFKATIIELLKYLKKNNGH